ncbi:MAG: hypothetical protein ACRC68_15320 [Clostridium sp.]
MDNETKKMFEILIDKLDNIEKNQNNLEKNQNNLEKNQNNLEKNQKSLEKNQMIMEENQNVMKESQNNMEIRQNEIFSVVKAIEHSNAIHKAEIDNITYKVAHTEGIINKIGNIINESRAVN